MINTTTVFKAGRYTGFLASMLLFTGILWFATRKLSFHTLEYPLFLAGFAALYFGIRMTRKAVKI